jgi:hypothetical protein
MHFMATKSHKKAQLPAKVCTAPMGARNIAADSRDIFCASSWQTGSESLR